MLIECRGFGEKRMSVEITINCDALNCLNTIDSLGSDTAKEILEQNNWHDDPTTDEYHYCDECWPAVKAEYEEVLEVSELA